MKVNNDENIMVLKGLTKDFGGLRAVDKLDMKIQRESIHGLIGPNGSGKTTVVNMISGVIKPTKGEVFYKGHPISNLQPHQIARKGIARTFQLVGLFKSLTVLENVMVGAQRNANSGILTTIFNWRKSREEENFLIEKAKKSLEIVGLYEKDRALAVDLPYGEQRLVEIARALAGEPEVLLLDEPAAGLNPAECIQLCEIIEKIASKKVTILIIEHHMDIIMNLCNVTTVIDHGKKIFEGCTSAVQKDEKVKKVYLGTARQ